MKDLLGWEIENGDWLVRSYNYGRSACLKFVKVLKDNDRTIGVTWHPTYVVPRWELDGSMGSICYPERTMIMRIEDIPMEVIQLVAEYENRKGLWH